MADTSIPNIEPCVLHEMVCCTLCKTGPKGAFPRPHSSTATGPDDDIGPVFAAKYPGRCAMDCGEPIAEGDAIRAYDGSYVHAECV